MASWAPSQLERGWKGLVRGSSISSLGILKRYIKHDAKAKAVDEDEGETWCFDDSSRVIHAELELFLAGKRRQVVDAARTFLPRILQRPYRSGVTIIHRCTGCVVFSDASGFTKLTTTLAQKADGAEVLSKCLNKFFTPLIDIIEAYRGDVMKFSGDALSILFEATDDYALHPSPCGSPDGPRQSPLQLACLRAAACCIEIHKKLHNFDTGEGGVRLTLHIGVGAGSITILQVGGEQDRLEYVIAGTPMEQIAVAEPLAGSGETVLSPQTWREIQDTAIQGPLLSQGPPGFQLLAGLDPSKHTYPTVKQAALECSAVAARQTRDTEDKLLLQWCERFIPRAVLRHLRSGNNSSINEMRSVTIIFVQIGGVDVSTERGSQVAQQLMLSMQRACYRQEGNLNKFLVDDKGLLFLFVFGLPPLMHIDDPVRAIIASFEMIKELQGMGLCGRFGVTTGRVFCGIVGSDKRREYTVMGDTVNLSARLMANAKENSVLIDEATYERSRQDVFCRRLVPIMVKGKDEPIPIFEPGPLEDTSSLIKQLYSNSQKHSRHGTDLHVSLEPNRVKAVITLPWRASSQLLGGTSMVLQLTRWRQLNQVEQFLSGPVRSLESGGALLLMGRSGSGKQELSEYLLSKAIHAKFVPVFGTMRARLTEHWRAVEQLIWSCLCVLLKRDGAEEKHPPQAAAVEAILRKVVQQKRQLHPVLEFLGFEGFDVPGERVDPTSSPPNTELEDGAVEIATELIRAVAEAQGVLVLLRIKRGTDINDNVRGNSSAFWKLSARLSQLAIEQRQKIRDGDGARKPILVVTLAREKPAVNGVGHQATISSAAEPAADLSQPREIIMSVLTEDAAVELMCLCLGLKTTNGGSLVKRKLREFIMAVSINMSTYIQECIQYLLASKCVEVSNGECKIAVQDLNVVNIGDWVQSSMVGGTIAQLESLGSAKNHIMKLATVFEGPFSPLDVAAANRVLFGRIPRILAFYDQAKLLCACEALVKLGFLRRVTYSVHTMPPDRAPIAIPRWTISNSLYQKVAGSMVLNSQRILIKRAVLIERALNVEMPKRMWPGQKAAGQSVRRISLDRSGRQDEPAREQRQSKKLDKDGSPLEAAGASQRKSASSRVDPDSLFSACAWGNVNVVQGMLNTKIDVNKAWEASGYTPLHFACGAGELEVVSLLCEHGADIDARSAALETPLVVAAQRGHTDVVQYLCDTRNALSINRHDKLDYWESVLPELLSEEDMPRPLTPATPQPSVTLETLCKRRRAVLAWLLPRLAQDGSLFTSEEAPELLSDPATQRKSSLPHSTSSSVNDLPSKRASSSMSDTAPSRPSTPQVKSSVTVAQGRLYVANTFINEKPKIMARIIPGRLRNTALRTRIQGVLRSRTVLVVMLIALTLALYMPDVWISCSAPDNLGLDVTLSVVMCLFFMEFTLLSLVDSSYPFSFFFLMDCIGTVSMVSDLSYFLGPDATQAQQNTNSQRDLTLFRATRTAKIGARASRLSRVVKLMRSLPGIGSRGKVASDGEKLQQISNHLTHVLSKRVACLTILLVIVMPLFTIGLYPEGDFSMQVWIESLSRRVEDAPTLDVSAAADQFQATLEQFALFYKDREYGPYEVCVDSTGLLAGCYSLDRSKFSAPRRRSFQLDVSASSVVASFDYSRPLRAEANMGIVLISLVVVLMCGACLLLNYSASELAVRPLARMLMSIKRSAEAIFSSVAALGPGAADEDFGENMDGEVEMMERVVRKIATLAELSSKKNPLDEALQDGMKSEELGVLALTAQDHKSMAHHSALDVVPPPPAHEHSRSEVTVTMHWQLEEIGITYGVLDSWNFNVLELSEMNQEQIGAWLLMNNPGSCSYTEQHMDMQRLRSFVATVRKGYLPNPYHNFMHAVDVTHAVFRYMTLMQGERLLSMQEEFSMLVAALGHDMGHVGFNNGFLTEVQHELAIRYNDRSPLENMHCCKLFEILSQAHINIFVGVPPEEYRDARKRIIDVILNTDIQKHPTMMKELQLLYEMNSKAFDAKAEKGLTDEMIEILTTAENKKLTLKVILHGADMSNPMKPWLIARDWAYRVLDEYASQGDQEKKLGIPVQVLNDRDKVNRPNSQITFIEFLIAPMVVAEMKVFPSWDDASEILVTNLFLWEQHWVEETNPSELEREKIKERLQKIVISLLGEAAGNKHIANLRAKRNRRPSLD